MLERIWWRIQPPKHIAKREQRHRDMQEREKQFAEFLVKEKKKHESKK